MTTFAQNLFLPCVSEICGLHANRCSNWSSGSTPAPAQRFIKFRTDFLELCCRFGSVVLPICHTFPCLAEALFLISSGGAGLPRPGQRQRRAPKKTKKQFAGRVHASAHVGLLFGPHVAHIELHAVAWKPLRLDLDACWPTTSPKNEVWAKAASHILGETPVLYSAWARLGHKGGNVAREKSF